MDYKMQRVELHVHTNMSILDGVKSSSEFVEYAESIGMKSIAITDFNSVSGLHEAYRFLSKNSEFKVIYGVSLHMVDDLSLEKELFDIVLLAKDRIGLRNIYKIMSSYNLEDYDEEVVLKSIIEKNREGVLVGLSSCLSDAMNLSLKEFENKINFFDYIEILPLSQYIRMEEFRELGIDVIENTVKKIIKLSKEADVLVVAVSNAHYIFEEESLHYQILKNSSNLPLLNFKTTFEMMEEFSFLGSVLANEIVIENTNKISDQVSKFKLLDDKKYFLKDDALKDTILNISSIKEEVLKIVDIRLKSLYGEKVNQIILDRADSELSLIFKHNYESFYYIGHLLVSKLNNDGYYVGLRGMVGSSFIAYLMNITSLNPLAPHYHCPNCMYHSFYQGDDIYSGHDLPDLVCPKCGTKLSKAGLNSPHQAFTGQNGEKVPYICLNISVDYQEKIREYLREIFGKDRVFLIGTLQVLTDKSASNLLVRYRKNHDISIFKYLEEYSLEYLSRVKSGTDFHPGGIIIMPRDEDIYEITPTEKVGDYKRTLVSHFDFSENIIRIDSLSHDSPFLLKRLFDYVRYNPDEFSFNDYSNIPCYNEEVYRLFCGENLYNNKTGNLPTLGLTEFGSKFTQNMLVKHKPNTYHQLVNISALSHGSNVYTYNAELLLSNESGFGQFSLDEVIACREDVMNYLISKGFTAEVSYKIMELVRKGRAYSKTREWNECKELMQNNDICDWFIWSCEQIRYMFPRSHAASYVDLSLMEGWFKINKPELFYCEWFNVKSYYYDEDTILAGEEAILERINEINQKGEKNFIDESNLMSLQMAYEAIIRGVKFLPDNSNEVFVLDKNCIRLPIKK